MKSDDSERRKFQKYIRRYIIARPDISFKIFFDGELASELSATDSLLCRLESVWGDGITKELVALDQPEVGPLGGHWLCLQT